MEPCASERRWADAIDRTWNYYSKILDVLQSLTPFRNRLTIVSGIENRHAHGPVRDHSRHRLSGISPRAKHLQARLGPTDRAVPGDYLDTVRDVKCRVEKAEASTQSCAGTACDEAAAFAERLQLMFDMMTLASAPAPPRSCSADSDACVTVSDSTEASSVV
jgi:hypothetical protein